MDSMTKYLTVTARHSDNKRMEFVFSAIVLLALISQLTFAEQITFIEVTEEAGIHFKHHDGRSGRRYFADGGTLLNRSAQVPLFWIMTTTVF